MPVVRVDVSEGHPRQHLLSVKRRIEEAIARHWAKEHIYVSVREMLAEPGDRDAIVTVDLRPGRGQEDQRAAGLYHDVLLALQEELNADAERFVLLIREFPEASFIVSGGKRLPPLHEITPQLTNI